ncbi:hypothetical protein F5884DRAFT_662453 [Xylogone sp. PMI_703]|nr:hypothetical protein F5884DRAFT_662453 [Xylogone sp. PMI_703]
MATGQISRNRTLSMGSGNSSKGRAATLAELAGPIAPIAPATRDFEPCAATASMFLYAQGSVVICAHHDTLTIERRFTRHVEEIQLLAVDNLSDKGAGRQVVSYDAGQTAIVWDCLTGNEIARFASYENLTVAAWMRNGNVAFGNAQGNVILFEPATSEHISARTIDQIPITAIAPSSDCRTYAIGFSNGSLLIAALQPRFTILHNLSTSRSPSPIVSLAWHASSSRQKSNMLATQTKDGDLRVWSVSKSNSVDTAKVVRILKRSENFLEGPNWLAWSKNGRIIQFSEGETSSWDVRTKHVTYDVVPTLDHVRGLAVYGPGATLFTLGANNTVQQFDLNTPSQLVANVQHPANLLPPSPPVSIEEQKKPDQSAPRSVGISEVPINIDISESDEDHMSPLARIAREMDKTEEERLDIDRAGTLSPVSSRSYASTTSRSSAGSRPHRHASVLSRGMSDTTAFSVGSSLHSSRQPSVVSSRDSLSVSSIGSSYMSGRSRPRGSRLRQEVLRSPDDNKVVDLFKFTKSRLSDIPYRHPQVLDNTRLTNDDLRLQMLSTIFGWDGDVQALIQDEMSRHPPGSSNRVLLAKWLGDIDIDILNTSSESMTSSDWMLLALSGIGGHASQTKVARAYVQRLLEKGDLHTAATIMIGMGDQNDAIEIYVSHKRYMEALILTALVFPADWQRQAEVIRKWGEWAVLHGQQQLAIRCFSCTGSEPSEPWTSPTAQALTFSPQSIPEVLSPPLSPPGLMRGPQRSIAKTSALKLITTFDKAGKSKFFGVDDDRTPLGAGVTPIAESALSPSGGDTAHTAFLRPSNRSVYNTPASARTATPGGFTRARLPSIGEMPSDVLPLRKPESSAMNSLADPNSEKEKGHERHQSQQESQPLQSLHAAIGRASTASPMMEKSGRKIITPLPSPSPDMFSVQKQDLRARNGSRDRKPDGLQIQWPPLDTIMTGDYITSPEASVASSKASRQPARSVSGSVASMATNTSTRSPLTGDRSFRAGLSSTGSPVITGRSIDQYISSLEAAQYHSQKQRSRQQSRERHEGRARSSSRKAKARERSEERGRTNARYIKPAKRSPTSPVPMSPEDLRDLGAIGYGDETAETASVASTSKLRARDGSRTRTKAKSSSKVRRSSPEPVTKAQEVTTKPPSRVSSRNASRRTSPDRRPAFLEIRGRSKGREGSIVRSPSSPLPMSPQAKLYQADDKDAGDSTLAVLEPKQFQPRQRSGSRLRERGPSVVRDPSPDRRRRDRSSSRRPSERNQSKTRKESVVQRPELGHARTMSDARSGNIQEMKEERARKKEQAARELEERRKSLARRPSVPPIVHPQELAQLSPLSYRPGSIPPEFQRSSTFPSPSYPPRSQTTSPGILKTSPEYLNQTGASTVPVGLPATPRAMRHPKFDPESREVPVVPQIPLQYDTTVSEQAFGTLNTLTLPKTTYQAAPRRLPPRSASAPIPEEPSSPQALPADLPTHPAFQAALPPSSRMRTQDMTSAMRMSQMQASRKIAPGESQPGTLGYETRNNSPVYSAQPIMNGIDETIEAGNHSSNLSNNNLIPPPPPPPPAPPMLKELQHLATPPPPPPPPIYRPNDPNTNSMVSGVSQGSGLSLGSGVIEIVMDDEDEKPGMTNAPAVEAQAPPQHSRTHSRTASISHVRGRSENDNTFSGRFSRAAERLRSASRGRNNGGDRLERTKSPQDTVSPYESVPPPFGMNRSTSDTPAAQYAGPVTERHPREIKAAMGMMEGGMF